MTRVFVSRCNYSVENMKASVASWCKRLGYKFLPGHEAPPSAVDDLDEDVCSRRLRAVRVPSARGGRDACVVCIVCCFTRWHVGYVPPWVADFLNLACFQGQLDDDEFATSAQLIGA